MQTNVSEFYAQNILPLSEEERRKLLDLIQNDLSNGRETNGAEKKTKVKKGGVRELFGSVSLGYATGLNNEDIDADLAREYMNTHEDED
ncbi:hypothetical protein BH20ACI1_BH20ACI1_01060 [soil metagenome]